MTRWEFGPSQQTHVLLLTLSISETRGDSQPTRTSLRWTVHPAGLSPYSRPPARPLLSHQILTRPLYCTFDRPVLTSLPLASDIIHCSSSFLPCQLILGLTFSITANQRTLKLNLLFDLNLFRHHLSPSRLLCSVPYYQLIKKNLSLACRSANTLPHVYPIFSILFMFSFFMGIIQSVSLTLKVLKLPRLSGQPLVYLPGLQSAA